MRKDLFASIGLLVLAAAYYLNATTIPQSTLDEPGVPGPSSLPTILAAVLVVIAITLGARALASAPSRSRSSDGREAEAPWPRALGILGIAVLYIPAALFLGYPIALFVLLVAVALYERKAPDWRLFAVAGGGAVFFWLLFDIVLGVRQPEGLLLPYLQSLF
jgi:hypothetical protein